VETLRGASFTVREGEILGIAGVEGNGQIELVEVLTQLRHANHGTATLYGLNLLHSSTRKITEAGVGYIPQDRQRYAMVLPFGVDYNMVLSTYYREPFFNGLTINEKAVDDYAEKLVKRFDIRTPSVKTTSGSLSGGNQQKCVVGREFSRDNKLLIAVQPTRGLDVGSIEFIHKGLISQRDGGVAVLLVSSELDEIMSLSDRIAVMYKGQIVAVLDAGKATREELGLLMAGAGTTAGAV
jgi:simple sugar transport system ATP-binding protein